MPITACATDDRADCSRGVSSKGARPALRRNEDHCIWPASGTHPLRTTERGSFTWGRGGGGAFLSR